MRGQDETREGRDCQVLAYGVVRAPFEAIAGLRKTPGPPGSPKVAPPLLKHADEQTVLGLAATLRALVHFQLAGRSFEDWAVVAAPRYVGRMQTIFHIDRFRRQGASTVSPLIIPHLSLHSTSGTISLALRSRGPNFGVGGAHGHLGEGLLAALSAGDEAPEGTWFVATAWDPEPVPDMERQCANAVTGHALALALTTKAIEGVEPIGSVRFVPAAAEVPSALELPELLTMMEESNTPGRPRRWFCPLPGGAIELTLAADAPQTQAIAV